jgi:redox-sensing transcriptional repressor
VGNQLVEAGIRGIVNFAPVILKVPAHVVVNNINLYDEVESVFYWIESKNHQPEENQDSGI